MKKFFTARDIAYAASRGEKNISVNKYDCITSVAKEEADKKGIKFVFSDIEKDPPKAPSKDLSLNKSILSLNKSSFVSNNKSVIAPEYKSLISEKEIDKWREEFPILKDVVHVANCSQSAQAKRVRGAINRYLDNWLSVGMDWQSWMEEIYLAKAEFAKLINADPSEIAISTSVSEAISSIASSLDFNGTRKKVLVTDAEFPTVNFVWLAQQKYGAKVDFVSVDENYEIDISEYEKCIDETTLISSVTHVYYMNGYKQDLAKITEIAHRKGSLLLVDSYQGLGTEPLDVKKTNIDILTTGNLKYLFGIPGVAFLYVNKDLAPMLKPAVTGWFGQEDPFLFQSRYLDWATDSRRFETGTPPVLAAYAARAGLEIVNEVGPERIKDRVDMLSAHTLKGCLKRGLNCISPFDVQKKGGTTAIYVSDKINSHEMEVELRSKNIIASARGDVIRVAPHFYTKPQEIDYVLDEIRSILSSK